MIFLWYCIRTWFTLITEFLAPPTFCAWGEWLTVIIPVAALLPRLLPSSSDAAQREGSWLSFYFLPRILTPPASTPAPFSGTFIMWAQRHGSSPPSDLSWMQGSWKTISHSQKLVAKEGFKADRLSDAWGQSPTLWTWRIWLSHMGTTSSLKEGLAFYLEETKEPAESGDG